MDAPREASSPTPWPPIIYAIAAISAALRGWFSNWSFQSSAARAPALLLGCGTAALGIVLLALAGRRFNRAGTAIPPNRPTTAIVVDGIYRHTRNPMYLGFTLLLLALGLLFDDLWFIVLAPFAVFAVTKLAIEREEAYLERKFGAAYVAYKQNVRRWL